LAVVEQVHNLAQAIVESNGAYVVDVAVRGRETGTVVEVFIDTDTGVRTDECARISLELSRVLDAANIFQRRYHLIVSSPGVDRPLRYPRQYLKNVGRKMSIKYHEQEQVIKVQGTLRQVTGEGVTLEIDPDSTRTIPFNAIVDARVQTPW
jgi:ribosome maturation factor RimP